MKHERTLKHRAIRFSVAGALTVCLGALFAITVDAQSTASKKSYVPASVRALPELQCKLYPTGSDPSSGLPVFTDDDGYARFHAVRASAGDEVHMLTLDCTDSAGKTYSYSVDLMSEDTFAPRPLNLANERGVNRPALKGDPLSYTQSHLIQAGYGLRPDQEDAQAYSQWLESASRPGRFLEAKRPEGPSHTVYTTQAPPWVGSVLTGKPDYISVQATFNVPEAWPGGAGTQDTALAIWNGLGGYGTGSGLIQGGVGLQTTPNTAVYYSWREYCCGDPSSNGYGGAFIPEPGDSIFSQEWYCDSSGKLNINGGYGCTHLHDLTSGAILDCTSPSGSPCWSVPALPTCSKTRKSPNCMTLGLAAEFIIENQSPQMNPPGVAFTDFWGQVAMSGSAYSSATNKYSQTISTDPSVHLLTDFTSDTTQLSVLLGASNQTYFTVTDTPSAIAVRSTGEADVVRMTANNSLMYYYAASASPLTWISDTIAGSATTFSAPAIAVRAANPAGEADVVAMGPNNSLMYYYATPGSSWSSNTIAGPGTTFSAPSIAVRSTGEADVVAMGPNNSLMYYHATPGSPWSSSTIAGPGTTFSAPAIMVRTANPAGEADVVAMGPKNSLKYYHAMPGSKWYSDTLGGSGTTFSAPAIAVRAANPAGEADVVAMGAENSLIYYHALPGKQWYASRLPSRMNGINATNLPPAIAVSSSGEAGVLATSPNWLNFFWATPGSAWQSGPIAPLD